MENIDEVVHLITTIELGGAEKALLSLAKSQVKNYKKVTVVPLKGRPQLLSSFSECGVFVDFSFVQYSFLRQIFRFRRVYRRVQIFHAHLPRAELLAYLSKSRPFFITRHNSETFFPGAPKFLSRTLSRVVSRSSKGVVAISKAVHYFLQTSNEISRHTKVTVVHYGYERRFKSNFTDRLVVPSNIERLKLLSVARLVPQKNIFLLLTLMEYLQKKNFSCDLTIVGDGPLLHPLLDEIRTRKLANVSIEGKRSDIVEYMTNFNMFVFASHYEGFGLVLLEAMDAGLLIVAPDHSSIPEVIGPDHPGLYLPNNVNDLAKTIQTLFTASENQKLAYKVQRHQLELFSHTKCFEAHDNIYLAAELLKKGSA